VGRGQGSECERVNGQTGQPGTSPRNGAGGPGVALCPTTPAAAKAILPGRQGVADNFTVEWVLESEQRQAALLRTRAAAPGARVAEAIPPLRGVDPQLRHRDPYPTLLSGGKPAGRSWDRDRTTSAGAASLTCLRRRPTPAFRHRSLDKSREPGSVYAFAERDRGARRGVGPLISFQRLPELLGMSGPEFFSLLPGGLGGADVQGTKRAGRGGTGSTHTFGGDRRALPARWAGCATPRNQYTEDREGVVSDRRGEAKKKNGLIRVRGALANGQARQAAAGGLAAGRRHTRAC